MRSPLFDTIIRKNYLLRRESSKDGSRLPEKLTSLEAEYKTIDDANKLRANEIRNASNGARITLTEPTGSYWNASIQNSRN